MIRSLSKTTKGCPFCSRRQYSPLHDSFAALHPNLMDEYSPINTVDPNRVFSNSEIEVEWVCRNNPEHIWRASFNDRHHGNFNCPLCYTTKVRATAGINSFADIHPDLLRYWSPNNERSPSEVRYDLKDGILWLCPECGGEYSKLVSEFIANPNDCPYCNDRKPLTGYNTLAVRYPTLLGDWDYTNNYVLADPDQILPTSSVKVWWTCHNDPSHHYPQQVSDKVLFDKRHQESCIYCKGRRRKKHHFV